MGWPRTTSSFPEPTWWNGDELDDNHCPQCGEPRPHYCDGVCELCWFENEAAEEIEGDDKP